MSPKKVFTLCTFVGAAVASSLTGAVYPMAIWSAAYMVISRRKQSQPTCPLLQQIAASKEREK